MRALPLLLALVLPACSTAAVPQVVDGEARRAIEVVRLLDLATGTLDSARHRVERGAAMAEALGLARGMLGKARSALGEETGAVTAGPTARVREAALAALEAGEAEVEALGRIVHVDLLLEDAVAAWSGDRQGPSLEELDAEAAQLGAARPQPAACDLPWRNRLRWLRLVADRSMALADPATPVEVAESFRADPYGEVRRVADAADRDCWLSHSGLVLGSAAAAEAGRPAAVSAAAPSRRATARPVPAPRTPTPRAGRSRRASRRPTGARWARRPRPGRTAATPRA